MGLTPLCGLPGATRAGSIDPSLIFHYTNNAGRITHAPGSMAPLHVTEVPFPIIEAHKTDHVFVGRTYLEYAGRLEGLNWDNRLRGHR